MKSKTLLKYIKLIFIISLILLIGNLFLKNTNYRISYQILNALSILVYLSAIILFLYSLKSKQYLQTLFFALFPLFLILNFKSNQQIEKIFSLFHLNPIIQNNIEYKDNNLVIYYEPNISLSHQYNIYKKEYFILEKKISEIAFTNSINSDLKINQNNQIYTISYSNMIYNTKMQKNELHPQVKTITLK